MNLNIFFMATEVKQYLQRWGRNWRYGWCVFKYCGTNAASYTTAWLLAAGVFAVTKMRELPVSIMNAKMR